MSNTSAALFSGQSIPLAPLDPILGLNQRFKEDTYPDKVNLGVGAYRDDEGRPYVLKVVREAERILSQNLGDKEYLPQDGLPDLKRAAANVMFGKNSSAVRENRICISQTISGTGALRVAFEFIRGFMDSETFIYLPNPTWGNHNNLINATGLQKPRSYRYFDMKTKQLDLKGMLEDLADAPKRSVILLHLCAHNPTGVDPTPEQWKQIYQVMKERDHLPLFDSAYQGFATGSLEQDAFAARYFESQGSELIVSQSFAKNLGLYGERVGCLSFVCQDSNSAANILSQIKVIVRRIYSSPPLHGARIAALALGDERLYQLWQEDLNIMSTRIKKMRKELYDQLVKLNTPGNWEHIINQIGMFSFTGLTREQSERMVNKHHIYMLSNGRISMAGLNSKNCAQVASAIHECVTNA